MNMKRNVFLISAIVLILDQVIKIIINNTFLENTLKIVISGFFYITKTFNTGGAWSILSNQTWFLIIAGLILLIYIISIIKSFKINKRNKWGFGLLIGGILGNLIDRIIYGHVIDYLAFNIINYQFPVFNLADICIVLGTFLIIISVLKGDEQHGNNK